jgi:hypothetical protein
MIGVTPPGDPSNTNWKTAAYGIGEERASSHQYSMKEHSTGTVIALRAELQAEVTLRDPDTSPTSYGTTRTQEQSLSLEAVHNGIPMGGHVGRSQPVDEAGTALGPTEYNIGAGAGAVGVDVRFNRVDGVNVTVTGNAGLFSGSIDSTGEIGLTTGAGLNIGYSDVLRTRTVTRTDE